MAELDPETLAAILSSDGYALIPLSPEQRMRAAMEVRAAGRRASSDTPGAQAMRRRLASVEQILGDEARQRLLQVPLLWVDSSLPHAAVLDLRGQPAILLCSGLFDLVHFQTALTSVCSLLQSVEAQIGRAPDLEMPPSGLMMLAGHVILADAYGRLRPPATIADMLGPNAARDVDLGVSTSIALLLLHELGHVELGHAHRTRVAAGVSIDSVADPSQPDERSRLELEADAYSLRAIAPAWRAEMLAGLISLHNVFQIFEVFGVRPSHEYPTADRRLAAMLELLPLTGDVRKFGDSWLADYRRRQAEIAAEPTTPDRLLARFESTMDVATAYGVVNRIRTDLAAAGTVLDTEPAGSGAGGSATEDPP